MYDVARDDVEQYEILGRSGGRSTEELEEAAAHSSRVGSEEMPDDGRWIRSYVVGKGGGSVVIGCSYGAAGPEAIRNHAALTDLPVDEIIAAPDSVVVPPDPQPANA